MKQKTPPYRVIKKLLKTYNNDALNLESKGLIDLPDKGNCIRASHEIMSQKDLWLEALEKLDLMDRLKIALENNKGMMP